VAVLAYWTEGCHENDVARSEARTSVGGGRRRRAGGGLRIHNWQHWRAVPGRILPGRRHASISVLKGDAYVRIAVGTAPNLSQERTLARDALPRM
jgi:hypothetical protein